MLKLLPLPIKKALAILLWTAAALLLSPFAFYLVWIEGVQEFLKMKNNS